MDTSTDEIRRVPSGASGWRNVMWSTGSLTSNEMNSSIAGARSATSQLVAQIAVDGHDGAVLGQIGEQFAVGAGRRRHRSALHGDGLGRRIGGLEHREALVAALVAQDAGLGAARFRVPGDVLRATPMVRPVTVGVGHDQTARLVDQVDQRVALEAGAVEDEFRSIDHPGRRGIDQTGTVTGQHHRIVLHPDRGHGIGDAHEGDGRHGPADAGVAHRLFVDDLDVGRHDGGLTEALGRQQAGIERCLAGEEIVDDLRPGDPEPVERDVVGHPEHVDAEQPSDRRDGGDVDHTVLEAIVEREHEIHRRRAPERQEVTCQQRPLGEPWQRLIDGVTPAERTEFAAGQLEDPIALGERVEGGGRLRPGLRRILVALELGVDETAVAQRWHVGDREDDDHGRQAVPTRTERSIAGRGNVTVWHADTSAAALRPRPSRSTGMARVLLRNANAVRPRRRRRATT